MHVKQRNLLLFRVFFFFFCLLCAVWVVNCRQVQSEKQEGERGSGRPMCLKQNTVDTIRFYGSNASRTNWLQTQPAECAFHVAFPVE